MNIVSDSLTSAFFLIYTLVLQDASVVESKISHIYVQKDFKCNPNEYFDHSGLTCVQCSSLSHPIIDGGNHDNRRRAAGCQCEESSTQENEMCGLDEMRGGLCMDITCTPKCNDILKPTSLNNLHCTTCNTTMMNGYIKKAEARFDKGSGSCTCDNPLPVSNSASIPVSNRKLIEMYDPVTGFPIGKECKQCPKNTAVITSDLLKPGEEFHTTGGIKFYPNPYECVSCPDPNMYFDKNYKCKCASTFMVVGETSLGAQKCIQHSPSYSSDYDRVTFPFIRRNTILDQTNEVTLRSILFSHHYLEAASLCEFPTSDSVERSLNACQTLANLCVMNYYDKATEPCSEFQYITRNRISSYHGQGEWKQMMPWLYYNEEVDDIVEDRGIKMSMSLNEHEGYENNLYFKVAKYSLDGKFISLERLTHQLVYCPNIGQYTNVSSGFRFGFNKLFDFRCSIGDLMNQDMFFYDLYLLDMGCVDNRSDNDCLYPVPVLNRNYIDNGKVLPNQNNYFGDELDDRYTRRFFLFDNMSGKDSSGLKAIRFASSIKVQTKIQSQAPGKIYPPKLIIEYRELEITDDITSFTASFETEYTMPTADYWSTVEILSGFVSAITLVVWLFRVWNCHARQRRNNASAEEVLLLIQFVINAVILGVNTVVIVFFPFICLLSFYWYIFIKLQQAVFILLPPDNGYEYLFFTVFIQCLCWGQTMYIIFLIYKQCQLDIFFVDWERPKTFSHDVSMWRTVFIANEFNKLQFSRRNLIEINLVFLMFLINQHTESSYTEEKKNIVLTFSENCFLWLLVSITQLLFRYFLYDRYYSEPKGQRFIDLCTLAKISIFILDERHHGFYLHCRSPYEFADCNMEKMNHDMTREASGTTMNKRGLDVPGCPSDCQVFELFVSDIFQRTFRKPLISKGGWRQLSQGSIDSMINEKSVTMRTELQSFLISFIEQSPSPSQEGLKRVIREPIMLTDKILGVLPDSNRLQDAACVLAPDLVTWTRDYKFLTATTFFGVEAQLLLHDILVYNLVNVCFSGSPFLSIAITYIVHLMRVSTRRYFGSKNLFRKAFLNEIFRCGL